jgi:hypothetical protein
VATKKKKAKAKPLTRTILRRAMEQVGQNPSELISIVREFNPAAAIEMETALQRQQQQPPALSPEPEWEQPVLAGGIFAGRIADRRDIPLYDSFLYPDTTYEGKPWLTSFHTDPGFTRFRCFSSSINIGWQARSNMHIPGALASDSTYRIRGLQVKIWSDRADKWSNILAMANALASYELIVGERPFGLFYPTYKSLEAEQLRVLNMEYLLETEIHVPARQNFGVNVMVPVAVKSEIEDQINSGAKFLWRVSLLGQITSDLQ